MTIAVTLFLAGMLTILLPCILPLIPIVLGVSIAGRSKLRPLLTVLGMVVSFVGFTFLLHVLLSQFVQIADYLRIGTYYVLLLFGLGFLTGNRTVQIVGALLGGLFFLGKGAVAVAAAAAFGVLAMHVGGKVATKLQTLGTNLQGSAAQEFGRDAPITAFIIGLTMGLVWVPCAGPALGFALTLVREQPGAQALLLLTVYGLGTALPLMLVGYGGQFAVHSVRSLTRISGRLKQVSGAILVFTALAFQFHWFRDIEIWLVKNTSYGTLGTDIERRLFGEDMSFTTSPMDSASSSPSAMQLPKLPKIIRAPEFVGLGPWHSSEPFTLAELRGKVVLVDFWTYSCINCIRTLPYIQGYWEKFAGTDKFVLLGVHTPEFVFEKDRGNVADAIKRHGLTYPVAQDNDYGTWRAFANRYWPAKYLIDAEGYVRYTHFGEGAYEETERAIASLLAEIGVTMEETEGTEGTEATEEGGSRGRSPETYLGSRSWPSLQNGPRIPTDDPVDYAAPASLGLHRYALDGTWQLADDERQVLRSESGEIRMRFLGAEINLVMGVEGMGDAPPPEVAVLVDDAPVRTFAIDRYDLFELWKGPYGEHEIILKITGAGAEGYAFTFGS